MQSRLALCVAVLCVVACSKPKQEEKTSTPPTTTVASAAVATTAAPVAAPAAEPTKPATPKKYKNVLHTGDSMVGGGLALALRPKFEADGTKYHRDVIESGTIHEFSQNDHLPDLIAKVKPDLILVTLGANHIPHSIDPEKEIGPFVPKLIKRVSNIDCYWVAPPIWKPTQAKFNEWLSAHVAPCKWYDAAARSVDIARRPDKIHPNEKGGEAWADDFWKFYKGEGAFTEAGGAGGLTPASAIGNTPAVQLLPDAGGK